MPISDADVLRVGTSIDTSGLRDGTQQLVNEQRSQLAILKQQYVDATRQITEAVKRVVDAEKQAAEATQQGHERMAQAIQEAAKQERAALDSLIAKQDEVKASISKLGSELQSNTVPQVDEVKASVNKLGSELQSHTVPQVAAASAAIRVFEGNLPIRAVERFLTSTLGLGPALTAIFPVVGAIAFAGVLERIVTDVYAWASGLKEIERFNSTIGKQLEQTDDKIKAIREHTADEKLRLVGLQQGPEAEANARASLSTKGADDAKQRVQALQIQVRNITKQISETESKLTAPTYGDKIGGGMLGGLINKLTGAATDHFDKGELDRLNEAKSKLIGELGIAQAQISEKQTEAAVKHAEAIKKGDSVVKSSLGEQDKALRQATELQVSALKEAGTYTVQAEKDIWEKAAAEATKGGTFYIEAHRRIGELTMQLAKTGASELARAERDAMQTAASGVSEFEKGQRLANAALRQGVAEANRYESALERVDRLANKAFSAKIKEEQTSLKEQQTADLAAYESGSTANLGNLDLQKLQVERKYSVSGDSSNKAQIAQLQELKAIDDQIIAEKIRTARTIAQLDQIEGNSRYAADLNKVAELERQAADQRYKTQTQLLVLQEHRYQQFFSTIQHGFENAVDSWIRTGQGFTAGMQNLFADLVVNFANNLIQMGVKWLEHEIVMTLAHVAGNEERVVSDASAAEQSSAITGIQTLKEVSANAVKAASGAYAATVGIPIIGPILAPLAAAGAFTAVEAFGALAAFETGGLTPANIGSGGAVALLHGSEAVLPAPLTSMLVNAAQSNTSKGGGSATINNTNNYNGITDGAFRDLASKHADHLTATVIRGLRRANAI